MYSRKFYNVKDCFAILPFIRGLTFYQMLFLNNVRYFLFFFSFVVSSLIVATLKWVQLVSPVSKNIIYEASIIYNKRASGNIHG